MNRHFPDNMPSFYKNRFCRRKTEESLSVSVTVSLEEERRERERKKGKKSRLQVKFPHYIGRTSFCTLCFGQGRQKESLKRSWFPSNALLHLSGCSSWQGWVRSWQAHQGTFFPLNIGILLVSCARILSYFVFHFSLLKFYVLCHICVRRCIRPEVNMRFSSITYFLTSSYRKLFESSNCLFTLVIRWFSYYQHRSDLRNKILN